MAEQIEQHFPHIRARAISKAKYRSKNRKKNLVNEILISNYVLICTSDNIQMDDIYKIDGVLTVLAYSDQSWKLYGADREYAAWVLAHDGLIGISKADEVGDKIKIVEGPLKDLEGAITRIDRRNRSGQIVLTVGGKQVKVWLAFEMTEES